MRIRRHLRRRAVALPLVLASLTGAVAKDRRAETVSLEQLLSALAKMPGLEARFTEEKHLALLAAPLRSSGRLYFVRPGYLLRRVESPSRSEVLVTPSAVVVREAERRESFDLEQLAELRPLVQALLWLLAGKQEQLEQVFRARWSARPGQPSWTLQLLPKAKGLAKLVRAIRIRGEGYAVRRVRIEEASGDWSLMTILAANHRRRFSAQEKSRLFGSQR